MGIFNPTQEGGAAFAQPTVDSSAANAIQGLTSLAGTVVSAFAKPEKGPTASEINMAREDAAWSQLEKSFNEASAFDKAGRFSQAESKRKSAIVNASKYLPKEKLNTFVMGQTGMDLSENLINPNQVRFEQALQTPEGQMAVAAFDPNSFDSTSAWRDAILTKTQSINASKMRLADQKLSFEEKRPDRINYLSSKVESIIGSKRLIDQTGMTLTTDQLTVASVGLQAERRTLLADAARSGASQEDIKEELSILDSADAVVKMFMEVPEKDRNRVSATVSSALTKALREKYYDAGVALLQELIKKDPAVLFKSQTEVVEFVGTILQPKPSLEPEGGNTDSSDLRRYSGQANTLVEKLGFEHPETRKVWGNQADVSRARSAEQNIYKIDAAKSTWSLTSIDRLAKYAAAYPQEGMDLVDKTLAAVNGQKLAIENYFVSLADQYGLQFDRTSKSFTLSTDALLTNVRPEVRAQVKAAVEVAARQFYNGSVLDLVMDNGSLLADGVAKQFAVNTNSSSGRMGDFRAIFRDRVEPYQKTLEHLDKVTRILPNPNGMAPVEDKVSSVQPDQTEDQSSFIDTALDFGGRVLGALNPISSAAAADFNQAYELADFLEKEGYPGDALAAGAVALGEGEGKWDSVENLDFSNTKNSRIRTVFVSSSKGLSDQELNQLKKDPVAFADFAYGKDTKKGKDLGNTQQGDGWKFRGRGYFNLTGRDNYKRIGDKIGVDLVSDPDLIIKDKDVSLKVAKAYLEERNSPKDIEGTIRAIGGDEDQWDKKRNYYDSLTNAPIPRPNPRRADQYFDGPFKDGSANLPRESQANASNIPVPPPKPSQDKITIGPGAEPEKQRQRNLEALGEEAKRYLAEAERTNDLAKWKEAAAKQRELIQSLLGQ